MRQATKIVLRPGERSATWRMMFGAYIRQLRLDAGLTQEELGLRLGWNSKKMMSQIETGRVNVPEYRLKDLAEQLGVGHETFLREAVRAQHPWIYVGLFGTDPELDAELAIDRPEMAPNVPGQAR